jgi:hypothetical protein
MRLLLSSGFLVMAVTVSAAAAKAESADGQGDVRVGSRVRLALAEGSERDSAPSGRLAGTVVRASADELWLKVNDGRTSVVPREAIERLEVSQGRRSRGRGALIGAGLAAAAGLATTAIWSATCGSDECQIGTGFGLFLYTPLAMMTGAGIGAAVPPGERWQSVPDDRRVGLRLRPERRGASVALALSF